MIMRSLRRLNLSSSLESLTLPPPFLLPLRANLTTATHTTDPEPPPTAYYTTPRPPPIKSPIEPVTSSEPSLPPRPNQFSTKSPLPPPTAPPNLALLPLLAAQTPHYIVAHIHSRPYLLTHGDSLRLPFLMPNAPVGSVLHLTRASTIGSREYTYRGAPWVDERHFVCKARVVGVESEPMRIIEKTKRRQRHVKTVKSKHRFTVVRCCELRVMSEGTDEGNGSVIRETSGGEGEGEGKRD